jgi:NADPH:quinone reductase-like Zn-dependent oxidoreductase
MYMQVSRGIANMLFCSSLIREVLDLYRAGRIKPAPITTFPVSKVVQAYRYFSAKERIGKVVISLEDDHALVPVC